MFRAGPQMLARLLKTFGITSLVTANMARADSDLSTRTFFWFAECKRLLQQRLVCQANRAQERSSRQSNASITLPAKVSDAFSEISVRKVS